MLPAVEVSGNGDYGFTARTVSSTKSDKPLFETPQSISVVTRDLIDARQATTLDESIQTVAGVTSSILGRRGWDDFKIRGQGAADTMYLDGLRIGQGNWIAQEVFGAERIEVLKGPASIYFGQVQPGGTVNIVSKRPRTEAFNQVSVTVGNYGYLQGAFDFGRPLNSENGKAAFRINGMAMNSDDPTDHVWFKNRYIAPSISLDFGARTDFTILAAINQRNYVRQQGLPVRATSLVNNGISVPRSFFASDTSVAPYDSTQHSIGYALTHRFDSGWTLNQNVRYLTMDLTGQLGNISGALNTTTGNFNRNVLSQDFEGSAAGFDTNIQKNFNWGASRHNVTIGFDANRDELDRDTKRCSIAALNIYNPVYGSPVTNCAYQNDSALIDTTVSHAALYLRDQIQFNERLDLIMALRHDRAKTKTFTPLNGTALNEKSSATTGNVGVMYKLTPNIAPYVSYASSFMPQSGITVDGRLLKPEEGRQSEIGVKFQSDDKHLNATFAYYDLTRKNVSQADPVNTDFQIEVGEERSKGFEAELMADLRNGWSLAGALSLLNAKVTDDVNADNIGQRLANSPRRTASILANYRFDGAWRGWGAGFGIRHESAKSDPRVTEYAEIPSYTVADANISYQGQAYRVQLNIKNLFDKDYFAGAQNNNVVPLGNPRTVMLKAVFDF